MHVDAHRLSSAERLLWGYGITDPSHIDLEAIAIDNGATVKYRSLGGCEARLVAGATGAVISISTSSNDGRQRFSLAHELAHWITDRKSGTYLCAKEDIGPHNAEAKSVEAEANAYASQLILPTYLVDPWMSGRKISLDVASQLGKGFNASLTAAAIKLVSRSMTPACLVCHNQSKLMWFRRSPSFPTEFYISPQLHQDTAAFTLAFSDAAGKTQPKRERADRWVSGGSAYRQEVTSQSIKLSDATVLTILSLVI